MKAYYPRALELFADITSPTVRAFLDAFPTPDALAALRGAAWRRWARTHHVKHSPDLWVRLHAPQVPVPVYVVHAKARLLGVPLAQLTTTTEAVDSYREVIADFFPRHARR